MSLVALTEIERSSIPYPVLRTTSSELALIRNRAEVEARYLLALRDVPVFNAELRRIAGLDAKVEQLLATFGIQDAKTIKQIETKGWHDPFTGVDTGPTNHDVKSVEWYLRAMLQTPLVHILLTSEDCDNIARAIGLRKAVQEAYLPTASELLDRHRGQVGFSIGSLEDTKQSITENLARLQGKFGGATGGWNVHQVIDPSYDWPSFAKRFIESFGLIPELATTQIVPMDSHAHLFTSMAFFNERVEDQLGDGRREARYHLRLANSLFHLFAEELTASRLQRDLSGSTLTRNFGVAIAHSVLGMYTASRGKRTSLEESQLADSLVAISPLDGRYRREVKSLEEIYTIEDAVGTAYLPQLKTLTTKLDEMAREHADLVMLGLTHGQHATPTTLGKELRVYERRLGKQQELLQSALATQRPYDMLETIAGVNRVLRDLDRDMWLYIMVEWFVQKGEGVGSSTMPNKINPINFENSEGNVGIANRYIERIIAHQRLQDYNSAIGYSLVALNNTIKGMGKVVANKTKIKNDLSNAPEVITEAIQVGARVGGAADGYERVHAFMKEYRHPSLAQLGELVGELSFGDQHRDLQQRLYGLTPSGYAGLAPQIARGEIV